jgi:5-methylcytosine-specific restriction endonuclease McrA
MQESPIRPADATSELSSLPDAELIAEVSRRAGRERQATADLIRALIEFDGRRLYLGEGYSSLFAYCTSVLHYSEHSAFNRIEVARAAARWPQLLACLEDGSLHLAGARLLAPHLTAENIDMALAASRHKSKREIEEVAAGLARRALLIAVAAEQYRLHLTISRATRDKLRQIQALLSHQLPDGNPAVIVDRALDLLLEQLQRQRLAATDRPRATRSQKHRSRHIPAAVKRAVWTRDEGRCAFVGGQGRCVERNFLEYHHVVPHAEGGPPTAANIELRCRAHNVYEAEMRFGPEVMAAARARGPAAQHDVTLPSADVIEVGEEAAAGGLVPGQVQVESRPRATGRRVTPEGASRRVQSCASMPNPV